MIEYTTISFYNDNRKLLGKFKSIEEVLENNIESLLKELNASFETIEYGAKLTRKLNYKIV